MLCPNCIEVIKRSPDGPTYYVYAEALMFAYLQRDEDKIAQRMAQMERFFNEAKGRCSTHRRPERQKYSVAQPES